jgi:hypothetical protein
MDSFRGKSLSTARTAAAIFWLRPVIIRRHQPKNQKMKNTIKALGAAAVLGTLQLTANVAMAQATVATTTTAETSTGTISTFGPDVISIRSETAAEPVIYHYSKSTTYVDEAGLPVSIETVKSGLPVTVYYAKDGDDMVASKVVVRKTTTTAPAAVETHKTTTTTTEHSDD